MADKHPEEMKKNYFRIFKSFCLYMSLVTLGFCGGIYGPTFLHMQYVLKTDTQGLGLSFIGENLGYLLGSVLCGSIFDRFNQELQLCCTCLWVGLSIAASPFVPSIYYYYILMTVQNLGSGFLDSAAPSYMLYLWAGHKLKEALVQGALASWSFGSFISPFIVIPFLYDLAMLHGKDTNHTNQEYMENGNASFKAYSFNDTVQKEMTAEQYNSILKVRYAYTLVGAFCILSSLFFLVAFLKGGLYFKKNQKKTKEKLEKDVNGKASEMIPLQSKDTPPSGEEVKETDTLIVQSTAKCFRWILIVLLFVYTTFLFWQDYVISLFISSFVQKGLHWESYKGPLITSVYRGSHGLGRIIGIFVATVLNPTKMLVINMTLATSSLVFFVCSAQLIDSEVPIWITMSMTGFAYSTTFPTIILWGAQYLEVKAAYSSMFLAASSIGGMSGSSFGAFLFQHYGHIHVFYLVLATSLFNGILFFIMILVRKHVNRPESEAQCNSTTINSASDHIEKI